jgi:hypothetical protein
VQGPAARKVTRPRTRRLRDGVLLAAGAISLALIIIGVVSSVIFVVGLVGARPSPTPTPRPTIPPISPILAAAHARATAIVRAAEVDAHKRGSTIARRALVEAQHIVQKAQEQARSIERAAMVQAAATRAASAPHPVVSTPASVPTAPLVVATPTPTVVPIVTSPPSTTLHPPPPGPTLDLSKLPSSWLAVACCANLSAFTVMVINRSSEPLSGHVTVTYFNADGHPVGSAYADFHDLAGHSTVVLPLSGERFPSNAVRYLIQMSDVH